MSGDHRVTSNYKKEVLTNSGFVQYKNTTIYLQNNTFVLSPSVAKNTQGYYWFDIREKIINRFDKNRYNTFYLIVRIVNVGFLIFPFQDIQKIMTKESKIESLSNKKVWSFKIQDNFTTIVNRKSKHDKMTVLLQSENDLIQKMKNL